MVHISSLSNKFVEDPHTVVKAGDIVKVKVLEVDLQRKRIALTMRLDEQLAKPTPVAAAVMNARKTTARQPNRADVKRSLPVTAR